MGRIAPDDPQYAEFWTAYPVKVYAHTSPCCHYATVLVRTSDGVQAQCDRCEKVGRLDEQWFLSANRPAVSCPQCGEPMARGRVVDGNYGFTCSACDAYLHLADLVPALGG